MILQALKDFSSDLFSTKVPEKSPSLTLIFLGKFGRKIPSLTQIDKSL